MIRTSSANFTAFGLSFRDRRWVCDDLAKDSHPGKRCHTRPTNRTRKARHTPLTIKGVDPRPRVTRNFLNLSPVMRRFFTSNKGKEPASAPPSQSADSQGATNGGPSSSSPPPAFDSNNSASNNPLTSRSFSAKG